MHCKEFFWSNLQTTSQGVKGTSCLRCKVPSIGLPSGDDGPRAAHDVLRCPNAGPAVIHGWLIGHGVVRLHLHGVVLRRRAIGAEDLSRIGTGPVLHAALVLASRLGPMASLLMDVSEEVHFGFGAVDGVEQCRAGSPMAASSHVEDSKRGLVGNDDVNTFWDVCIVVSGPGISSPRMPAGTPNLQAHDLGEIVIKDSCIRDPVLEIGRILGDLVGDMSAVQPPIGVPEIVVSRNDEDVLVLPLEAA